ncbi:hypothetical protein B0A55_00187 [Friedmanniomyces simplex]|uniref:DUF7025 domain-containing protein n=1 Tax=Friedmanniomyces simplex TaxID=329884 RepID=A0A4U0Y1B9_9PEZI|nr:hypothetical protein B0A55_00187 [Friedmanniomyces simplex]
MAEPSTETLESVVEEPQPPTSNSVLTPETTTHADAETKPELVPVKKGSRRTRKPKSLQKYGKHVKKAKVHSSSSESSEDESDSDSETSEDEKPTKQQRKKHKPSKKAVKEHKRRKRVSESEESEDDESEDEKRKKKSSGKLDNRKKKATKKTDKNVRNAADSDTDSSDDGSAKQTPKRRAKAAKKSASTSKTSKSNKKLQDVYKRVDEVWDKDERQTKLQPSTKDGENDYAEHAFLVRRTFSWKGEYESTLIDIKSRALRSVLREVMKNCKAVSLEVEEPAISPSMLFMYLEDLRTYCRKTLRTKREAERKRKVIKQLRTQRRLCKALLQYLDKDYKNTKKKLYPLLEAGKIEFDLLWALFKSNDVAVFPCYGVWEEPRCFRVSSINKQVSHSRGAWYTVDGQYLEYDGKAFGWAATTLDIGLFKGPCAINTLKIYPLKYHKNPAGIREKIVARGKRFIALQGMRYKFQKGIAFHRDKNNRAARFNVNSRVMVDSATLRRINPNYRFFSVEEPLDESDDEDDYDEDTIEDYETCPSDEGPASTDDESDNSTRYRYVHVRGEDGEMQIKRRKVELREHTQQIEAIPEDDTDATQDRKFSDEDLLLTTPVVLGFSFADKLWLELSVSGVQEIEYDGAAFDSLMLPEKQKDIVRALVESHKFNAAKGIDDVIRGKGKGLVHDIQRNALVSIFLRLLEYFQGILFLTTNRVDTFDEAFQSRIHLPLRYAELTAPAQKSVWKLFLAAVRKADSSPATAVVAEFSEGDLDALSRRQLNGRQIKNAVRTAQALSLREGRRLGMGHVRRVLDVNEEFDRDLKGGTGYTDAMRSYT